MTKFDEFANLFQEKGYTIFRLAVIYYCI